MQSCGHHSQIPLNIGGFPISEIIVIEDDSATLDAICLAVDDAPGLTLVGMAADYAAGETLVRTQPFDLMLVDLKLGNESGLELIKLCRQQCNASILVLSALGDEASVVSAIKHGADGYVLKDPAMANLTEEIDQVLSGEAPVTPSVARYLVRKLRQPNTQISGDSQSDNLSRRELQMLEALAHGFTYKEVASQFGLSYHTVVDYTRSLYRKLEVTSRTEAVVAGVQQGIISLER